MATASNQRRLAAIAVADVVGFSRLMEADEAGTLAALRQRRKSVLEPIVRAHAGRIVKIIGDGVLLEFASAVNAVAAAVELQAGMDKANASRVDAQPIILRIGINLGDVVGDGGDIYGDGVNVAARLEALAEPGGVCISMKVHEELRGKVAFHFADMGEIELKNIERPVRVYRLATAGPLQTARFVPPAKLAASETPVIAVLPIESISSQERWLRFANGLSSDITVDLARYSHLSVIAFHTMKTLAAKPGGFAEHGAALGADYIISGQLRADDRRARLTIQMADARTGLSLWNERYDRAVEDIFALQDDLTDSVINILAGTFGTLANLGRQAVRRKPPASLRAYDLYLLGVEMHNTYSRVGTAEGIRLLSRSVELDPNLSRAWIELAYAYAAEVLNGFSEDVSTSRQNWRTAVENALRLDPMDSLAYHCLGDLKAVFGDLDGAARAHQRALEYGYSHADTLVLLAGSKALVTGEPLDALPLMERAFRLNPMLPPWYHGMMGRILFVVGRYKDCVAALTESSRDSPGTLLFMAMALALDGQADRAAFYAAHLKTEHPHFTTETFVENYPVTNKPALSAIRDGARLAKLP